MPALWASRSLTIACPLPFAAERIGSAVEGTVEISLGLASHASRYVAGWRRLSEPMRSVKALVDRLVNKRISTRRFGSLGLSGLCGRDVVEIFVSRVDSIIGTPIVLYQSRPRRRWIEL